MTWGMWPDPGGYLRGLSEITGPASPGTVLVAEEAGAVELAAAPGDVLRLTVRLRNTQATPVVLAPALSGFGNSDGTRWFPAARGAYVVVTPGAAAEATLEVDLPADLPPGEYRGELYPGRFGHAATVIVHVAEAA